MVTLLLLNKVPRQRASVKGTFHSQVGLPGTSLTPPLITMVDHREPDTGSGQLNNPVQYNSVPSPKPSVGR